MPKQWNFIQFHTESINTDVNEVEQEYYDKVWSTPHMKKPTQFWELPTWIGQLCYVLKINDVDSKDLNLTILKDSSFELNDHVIHHGSVLEANKHLWKELIENNPTAFIVLGGYVGKDELDCYDNVIWFDSIEEYAKKSGLHYEYGTDWILFTDFECMPRLKMSEGCKHRCKFCTISNTLVETPIEGIINQIVSFSNLNFDLIYVDDKTFGQASNYRYLADLYDMVRIYNKNFKGFVVQTTAAMVTKINFEGLHIYTVEVGVETFNDKILKCYKKPITTKLIYEAEKKLKELHINFVPNLIVGFPEEDIVSYAHTIGYLGTVDLVYANIYNLAIYDDAEIAETISPSAIGDRDECVSEKSYNTEAQNQLHKNMLLTMYKVVGAKISVNEKNRK